MAQLREDEWPNDGEPTTDERQREIDPVNGPKDPHDPRLPENDQPAGDPQPQVDLDRNDRIDPPGSNPPKRA